jgi:RHH-type proline utilization regulon transcriptional repressor/proline dehydrogenase/delta 1-pyrroline-5-carboxylate dehydrogenase
MGEGLYETLVREQGYHTRIYAPVGGHRDLLAYLVRRLLENGANSSFVHQLADERMTMRRSSPIPVAKIAAVGGSRHPAIPLPQDLFAPERKNSEGLDLNDREELQRVARAVAKKPVHRAAADHPGPYAQPAHAPQPEKQRRRPRSTGRLAALLHGRDNRSSIAPPALIGLQTCSSGSATL